MPLSRRRLNILAKERKQSFTPIREFDNGTDHPVVLMQCAHADEQTRNDNAWMTLMCPCELMWKWEQFGTPARRTMIMTGGIRNCPAQEDSREVVRAEVRAKHESHWASMSLVDAAHDIWQKHCAGEYMGEHNVGALYVQDMERLLGTIPDVIDIHLGEGKNAKGEVVSPAHVEHMSFPSKKILSAINELRKRKLIDLSGMILIPYKQYFCFPDELHSQFAYWIEEPLGWPNGEAGDCFMFELYERISRASKWRSGEEVFGPANIPTLTPLWSKHLKKWLSNLDSRLVETEPTDKSAVLMEIPIEKWATWLIGIYAEVYGAIEG